MNESSVLVSIVIVTFNTRDITEDCIKSIYASHGFRDFEIILIDNGSSDDSFHYFRYNYPMVKAIRLERNFGFSYANNIGVKSSVGRYIFFLNSDTLLFGNTLLALEQSIISTNFDVAAPRLLNRDMSFQKSLFEFPTYFRLFLRISGLGQSLLYLMNVLSRNKNRKSPLLLESTKFDYASFAAIVVNKKVFYELGMLDENILFYHEDCEFGYRLRLNAISMDYIANVSLIHLGGASTSSFSEFAFENDVISLLYVFQKHKGKLARITLRNLLTLAIICRTFLFLMGFHGGWDRLRVYKKSIAIQRVKKVTFVKFQYKLIKRMFS